jgi:chromosome segregation ATPase
MGKIAQIKEKAIAQHQQKQNQMDELIMELRLLRESYEKLPKAISAEIVERLHPLEEMKKNLNEITQAQRAAIQELTTEIAVSATAEMGEATAKWNKSLRNAGLALSKFEKLSNNMVKIYNAQRKIIPEIKVMISNLDESTEIFDQAARKRGSCHIRTAVFTALITTLLTISAMIMMPWIWSNLQ